MLQNSNNRRTQGRTPDVAFPYADSTYRRRVTVHPSPGVVHGEMEDYCHHFAVRIAHLDGVVTAAEPTAVRYPYHPCVLGADGVRSLVGTPLDRAVRREWWAADRTAHCVHVVDLALVAASHAGDTADTEYEMLVAPCARPERVATLQRNGALALTWQLDGDGIVRSGQDPVPLASAAFFAWARAELEPANQEAAVVLRRACLIAPARGLEMDDVERATDLHPPDDTCYTHRRSVAWRARRNRGSTRETERDLGPVTAGTPADNANT